MRGEEARYILVVEDNPTNQKLIEAVLVRAGYLVGVAGSAAQARQELARRLPDLLLMDLQLPDQDGLSFTRELRAAEATRGVPVVALTAHAMVGDDRAALEAGCVGYLTKPIDTRAFPEQIGRFLGPQNGVSADSTQGR